MEGLFDGAASFDQPLNTWDTSRATAMGWMFNGAADSYQPLGNWSTASVTHMSDLFDNVVSFNGPLAFWDTSKAVDCPEFFYFSTASKSNQSLDAWTTSSVTTMQHLFDSAKNFNQPLGTCDTSKVLTWTTSRITTMEGFV